MDKKSDRLLERNENARAAPSLPRVALDPDLEPIERFGVTLALEEVTQLRVTIRRQGHHEGIEVSHW